MLQSNSSYTLCKYIITLLTFDKLLFSCFLMAFLGEFGGTFGILRAPGEFECIESTYIKTYYIKVLNP